SHRLPDGLIDWLAAGSGAQDGVDAAAATEPDTKQTLQAACDFAVRQATLFVQFDDGRLRLTQHAISNRYQAFLNELPARFLPTLPHVTQILCKLLKCCSKLS